MDTNILKMAKKHITLIPYGGLTNRMKAIESLIQLLSHADAEGIFIWFRDKGLNCRFDQLFQPLEVKGLIQKEASFTDHILYDRPRLKNCRIPSLFQKLIYRDCLHENEVTQCTINHFDFEEWVQKKKKVYLSSCILFYRDPDKRLFEHFHPIPHLQKRIHAVCSTFPHHTIGVHIRRTDNTKAIKQSPTSLFIKKMEEEIDKNPDVKFYVASDSTEEKKLLLSRFPNRIITMDKNISRSTVEGMQDALVELYILAHTRAILGSPYSSYAETAALIGNTPFEKVII